MGFRYSVDSLNSQIQRLESVINLRVSQKRSLETKLALQKIADMHQWLDREYEGIRRIVPNKAILNLLDNNDYGIALIDRADTSTVFLCFEDGGGIGLHPPIFQAAFEEMKMNAAVMDRAKDAPLYGCVDAATRQMIISSIFPLDNPDFNDNWRFVYYGMDKGRAIQAIRSSKWF